MGKRGFLRKSWTCFTCQGPRRHEQDEDRIQLLKLWPSASRPCLASSPRHVRYAGPVPYHHRRADTSDTAMAQRSILQAPPIYSRTRQAIAGRRSALQPCPFEQHQCVKRRGRRSFQGRHACHLQHTSQWHHRKSCDSKIWP